MSSNYLSLHSSLTRNCGRGRSVLSNRSAIKVGTPGLRGGPKIWVAVSNALDWRISIQKIRIQGLNNECSFMAISCIHYLVKGETTIKSKWVKFLPCDGLTASSRLSCLHCSMPSYAMKMWARIRLSIWHRENSLVNNEHTVFPFVWFTGVSLASHNAMSLRHSFEPVSREALLWKPSACLYQIKPTLFRSCNRNINTCNLTIQGALLSDSLRDVAAIFLIYNHLMKWTFFVLSAINMEKPEFGGPIENWKESPSILIKHLIYDCLRFSGAL